MTSGRQAPGAAVVVEQASVVVGGKTVLGPLSLDIRHREHWAILGPNGAGKTMLLRLFGAERHPTTGSVEILGERLGRTDVRTLRSRIGVVGHQVADRLPPHSSVLDVVLTGRDGILFPGWGQFESVEVEGARAALAHVGCGHLADRALSSCSQGERQRILIARSFFGCNELLLLDEPALGVDLAGRERLIGVLDSLSDVGGPTTVMVVHALEELPGSTTHAALLANGALVAAGPARDVLADGPLSACFGVPVSVGRIGRRYTGWVSDAFYHLSD